MITLRPFDANDYLLECEFEGDTYFVRMSWNSEGEYWSLGIEDYAHSVILHGVMVVPGAPLLRDYRHLRIPPGDIMAVLLDDQKKLIGRDDFMTGVAELVYVERIADASLFS